jgi:serine protease Do
MRRSAMHLLVLLALVSLGTGRAGAEEALPVSASADLVTRLHRVFAGDAPAGVDELKAMQDHVKSLTEKVMPATVGVQIGQAWGSGVVISKDGYVLTAAHVAGQADRTALFLLHDGSMVKGKTLGLNRTLDAGLMKITDPGEYAHVEMGKSKNLRKGQWCLAVGHPGGYHKERGLVVRLGRVIFSADEAITSDCTLVGGDSGGPLFDMEGRVIGINSRIAGAITANLHVPVDTFHDTWDRLVKAEVWGHLPGQEPVLGIRGVKDVDIAKVAAVGEDSPAAKAGIKAGDIVTKVGDHEIKDFASVIEAVLEHEPGDRVAVALKRGEEDVTVTVVLGRKGGE